MHFVFVACIFVDTNNLFVASICLPIVAILLNQRYHRPISLFLQLLVLLFHLSSILLLHFTSLVLILCLACILVVISFTALVFVLSTSRGPILPYLSIFVCLSYHFHSSAIFVFTSYF